MFYLLVGAGVLELPALVALVRCGGSAAAEVRRGAGGCSWPGRSRSRPGWPRSGSSASGVRLGAGPAAAQADPDPAGQAAPRRRRLPDRPGQRHPPRPARGVGRTPADRRHDQRAGRRPGRDRRRPGRRLGRRARARPPRRCATCAAGTARSSSPATTSTSPATRSGSTRSTRLGMRPLRNERVELPGGLDLAGVNDVTGASATATRPDFANALAGRDPSPAGGAARPPADPGPRRGRRTGSTCSCPGTPTAARWCRST